jgi:hypothetical protein
LQIDDRARSPRIAEYLAEGDARMTAGIQIQLDGAA